MKGQFIKDIMLIRRDIIISLIVYVIFIIIIIAAGLSDPTYMPELTANAIFSMVTCAAIPLILLTETTVLDDKCGYMQNVFSSPVKRKDYVKEKYLLALMLDAAGIILGIIYAFVMIGVSTEGFTAERKEDITLAAAIIIGSQIYASTFIISFSVKKNASKMIGMFFGIVLGGFMLISFISGFFKGFSEGAENPAIFVTYVKVMIALAVITWLIMLVQGFRWADKKEF